jgi:hypothetical protein
VLLQAPEVADGSLILFERAGVQRLAGKIIADVAIQLGTHGGDFIGAEEVANEDDAVAFNALWPRTGIATAAIRNALAGDEGLLMCRTPDIMADAAYWIINQPSKSCTGNFWLP